MGSWSGSSFGNDDALDFILDLQECEHPYDEIIGVLGEYMDFIHRDELGELYVISDNDFQDEKTELINHAIKRNEERQKSFNNQQLIDEINSLGKEHFNEKVEDYLWFAIAACESLAAFLGSPSEEFLSYYDEESLNKTISNNIDSRQRLINIIPAGAFVLNNIREHKYYRNLEVKKSLDDLSVRLISLQEGESSC